MLIKAAALLLAARCGLAWLGYERLRKILVRINRSHQAPAPDGDPRVDRVLWALQTAGNTVLNARGCLPLAIVTQCWLSRLGVPSDLRIAVKRDEAGKLEAHAWVEQDGRVLIGGSPSIDHYQTLPALKLWT